LIEKILTGIICILLVLIAIEDFRYMQIRLLWFLLLLPISILASLLMSNFKEWITITAINGVIVLVILLSSGVLVLIRNKWSLSKLKSAMGLGDILILITLALSTSTLLFVVILQLSLVLTLLYYVIRKKAIKQNNNRVPLAGACATLLCLILITNIFLNIPPLYNDFWLLNQIGLI
jgi:hypothetical protein